MQISMLSSGKSFIGKRKKFIFNVFVDFKRFENKGDVTEFGCLNHIPGKRVLNNLKTICLRFWKVLVQRITVIKLRVNNRCGKGTGSFEVKIGADTTKFTNVIITRLRERYLVTESEMTVKDEAKVPS